MPSRKVNNAEEELAKVRSLLQSGQKVFLRHDHSAGFLHEKAQWSGEYHLAHVLQSWDNAESNTFQVMWVRDGRAATATYTLRSPSQVLIPVAGSKSYVNMTVGVEGDVNGQTHTAKIVNLLDGSNGSDNKPGEVEVKWDWGFVEVVNVSQVSFGCRRRKRKTVTQVVVPPLSVPVAKKAKGKRQKTSKPVEIISIDSSSSDGEEAKDVCNRKQPPSTAEKENEYGSGPASSSKRKQPPSTAEKEEGHGTDPASSSSTSSSVESMTKNVVARMPRNKGQQELSKREGERKQPWGDVDENRTVPNVASPSLVGQNISVPSIARMPGNDTEENAAVRVRENGSHVGTKSNSIFVIPTAIGRLFSEEDLPNRNSGDYNIMSTSLTLDEDQGQEMAAKESSPTTKPPSPTTGSLHKSIGRTAEKTNMANIQKNNSSTSSFSSYKSCAEKEANASTSDKEGLLTQEVSPKEGWMSAASSEDSAASYSPSSSSDDSETDNLKGVATTGSLCSELSNAGKKMNETLDRSTRRRKTPRDNKETAAETNTDTASSHEVEEVATMPKRTNQYGKTKGMTTQQEDSDSSSSDEDAAVFPKRIGQRKSPQAATPQKGNAASASTSEAVMMNGFCRSIPQMKDSPKHTIEMVKNMLDRARECKDNSDEYRETLVDVNMLLQETLYNLNGRTSFVPPPKDQMKSPMSQNDGNKGHILHLAKRSGLTQQQIDELFQALCAKDGYYSIDKAIPIILSMKNSHKSDLPEAEAGKDNHYLKDTNEDKKRKLELLGSRVKTAFDDDKEHEGTITTVHYRVTYDDKDTETFVSEVEAHENLACNDAVLNGSTACDKVRCSMLELFSGCSLLSTLCKRRGMHVMSIDNDFDSNATIKADFCSDYVQSMLSSQVFDYIHMSPVCRTYSLLAGGKHRGKDNYNKTSDSHDADSMLMHLYFFIEKALETNKHMTVTIENPRAYMRKGNIMKDLFEKRLGFGIYHINYCQFGRGEKKPTNIWTNDKKLGGILEKIGNKCDCSLPHEESVKGSGHDRNFAALPMKLCQVISSYVHSKHTQLKFDEFALSSD